MFAAVIAAILAGAAVVAIVVVILVVRARGGSKQANPAKEVKQLDTVGVGSSPFERNSHAAGAAKGEVRVGSGMASAKKPGDMLSTRFTAMGAAAAAIFGVLTAKLWSMQVMSGSTYTNVAEDNLYTTVATPAPRGLIFDRAGVALVTNRTSQTVLADPDVLDDNDVMRRLSAVLGLPLGVVRQRITDASAGAQSQRVVARDVRVRDVAFISEHADAFPGVTVESRTVRSYPYGALAAHVLGYTGAPSEEQLQVQVDGRSLLSTDTVGKSGIEAYYDHLLSGDHGQRRVMVDALGKVVSLASETKPTRGSDLHLTLCASAQYLADRELAGFIAPEGDIGTGRGVAGAVVAMDVTDGSVLVMSSYPTYDPALFTGGIPQSVWDLYNTDESHAPLTNRAVNGQYASASTYKAFTSMAGLNFGFATDETTWNCTGAWDGFGSGDIQHCWDLSGHGEIDLRTGIVQSCDVVFYEIAKSFYDHGPYGTGELSETALQDYLKNFNLGIPTGVDVANESSGRVPTPEWKAEQWRNVPSEAQWRGGDYSNMIIGQGDVLVTPIQIACAYGCVATGKIVRPHLLGEVRNAQDTVVAAAQAEVVSEPDLNPEHLAFVREALHGMIAESPRMAAAFSEQGLDAAGKSGTAEHSDRPDDAWFVAYAPYENPRYVACCIIEQGGGGTDASGPIVAKVLGEVVRAAAGEQGNVARVAGSSGKSVKKEFTGSSGRTD